MPAPTITRIAIAALVLGVAGLALFLYPGDGGRENTAACLELPVVARVPSVAMDQERGVAYLAYLDAGDRSSSRPVRGTVMLLDLNVAEPGVRAALLTDPPNFQPVALSLYASEDGPRRLFVIDDTGAPGTVRIFEQSPSGAFGLLKSVQDPLLGTPAAIAAAGPDKFYVRSHAQGAFARLSVMLGLPRFTVEYYDGTRVVAAPAGKSKEMSEGRATGDGAVYENAKTRKRLHVIEKDSQSQLLLCPAADVDRT